MVKVGKNKQDPITKGPKVRKEKKGEALATVQLNRYLQRGGKRRAAAFFFACCIDCPQKMTTEKKSMEEVTGFLQSVAGNGSAGGGKSTV